MFTDEVTFERKSAHPRASVNPKSPPDALKPDLTSPRLILLTSLNTSNRPCTRPNPNVFTRLRRTESCPFSPDFAGASNSAFSDGYLLE